MSLARSGYKADQVRGQQPSILTAKMSEPKAREIRTIQKAAVSSAVTRLPSKAASLVVDSKGRPTSQAVDPVDRTQPRGVSLDNKTDHAACRAANRPESNKGSGSGREWVPWCKTGRSGKH